MACLICGVECSHGRLGPGLTITKINKETPMYTLKEDLYMDATQTKAVPDGPEAAYVLGVRGSQIPDDLARKLGLLPEGEETKPAVDEGPFKRLGLATGESLNGRNVRMVDGHPMLKDTAFALEDEKNAAKAQEAEKAQVLEKEVKRDSVQDKAVAPKDSEEK